MGDNGKGWLLNQLLGNHPYYCKAFSMSLICSAELEKGVGDHLEEYDFTFSL